VGNGQAIGVSLFKNRTYNPLTDFTHVRSRHASRCCSAVSGGVALPDLQDVVAAARKNPGQAQSRRHQSRSTQNLSAHMFKQRPAWTSRSLPYKDDARSRHRDLRRDVDVGFDYLAGFQGAMSDNKVRIIATSGEERDRCCQCPDREGSGFPDYVVTSWNGLASAAGMPADVLAKLNGLINVALADPGLRDKAMKLGMDARGSTPKEMRPAWRRISKSGRP